MAPPDQSKKSFFSSCLRIVLGLVIFAAAAFGTERLSYRKAQEIAAGASFSDALLPRFSGRMKTPNPNAAPTTLPTPVAIDIEQPEAKVWDGASRVTILVMGLDYRDWKKKEGPPRTDSMILLTVDPVTKTAGMLSIPRDLWVEVPGFGHYKINTAYFLGEANKLPGGGPGLAVKTVERFLGVPINYYAQIDFSAFVKFIDELDGITVYVPDQIEIDPIGQNNTIKLGPGLETMDGKLALAYARARYTANDDIDRSNRQQEVILAVRRRLEKLGARLLPKAPMIYKDLASGIDTNMTFDDAVQLGLLALQVDMGDIQRAVIGPPKQVLYAKSPDGLDILVPVPSNIRVLRDQIFEPGGLLNPVYNTSGLLDPKLAPADLVDLVKEENARISLVNGTGDPALLQKTAAYLASQGVSLVSSSDGEYLQVTRVTQFSGKPYTYRYLLELLKVQDYGMRLKFDPNSPVDVEIYLGEDWVKRNKLP